MQNHAELRPGTCAAHGAFEAEFEGHFFELFAVLVLAVVHGVDELMHQGVDHVEGIPQGGRDEYLVHPIASAFGGPALANVAAANPSAGEATRHLAHRQGVALGDKQGFEQFNRGQQPVFTGFVVLHGWVQQGRGR